MRALVLCADDYGLRPGVSRAILALAESGRISATSCLTNMPGWRDAAPALAPLRGRVGIGLHLNLTEGFPLGPLPRLAPGGRLPSLGRLLATALAGRLDEDEVGAEIERQLAAFQGAAGRAPDFVDGHQHVHVLPGIRGPLLRVLSGAGLAGHAWLRDPADRPDAILARGLAAPKGMLVAALAAGFGSSARRAGFATNRGFSGFSPFDPARDPAGDMAAYLRRLGPAPLVMCHPGEPDTETDPIGPAREREAVFLTSPAFPALLTTVGARLAPRPAPREATLDASPRA